MAKRQLRVKNPIKYNDENLRRWLLLYFPKYMTESVVSWTLLYENLDERNLIKDLELFFAVTFIQINQSLFWKYIHLGLYIYNKSTLSVGAKLKYWKFYMSDTNLALIALKKASDIFSVQSNTGNERWTRWLKDNYV